MHATTAKQKLRGANVEDTKNKGSENKDNERYYYKLQELFCWMTYLELF